MGFCFLFTLLMTVVPAAAAIAYAVVGGKGGGGSPVTLQTWLYVCASLQLTNLLVVWRAFIKFDLPYNPADPKDKDYMARMNHLLCYDPFVACYLVVVAFQVAWQILGHVVRPTTGASTCDARTLEMADAAFIIVWVFLGIGAATLACSYLAECCSTRCCPCFLSTACGGCLACCCPGIYEAFAPRSGGTPSVTTTGRAGPAPTSGGLTLAPVVPVYLAPPGPPRPGAPAPVYTAGGAVAPRLGGASYAAASYTGAYTTSLPPHQRGPPVVGMALPPAAGVPYAIPHGADPHGAYLPTAAPVAGPYAATTTGVAKH